MNLRLHALGLALSLSLSLSLGSMPLAQAQEGDAVAEVSDGSAGGLDTIEGRDPGQIKTYNATADRFRARMAEFEDDARRFLDEREREERVALSEGYDALIDTLTELEVNQRGLSIERFEAFLERYPDAPYASHVRFRLADLYYEQASEDWLVDTEEYYAAVEKAGDDFELLEELGEEPKVDLSRSVALYQRIIRDNRHLPPEQRYEYLDGALYMLGFCQRDKSTTVYDSQASHDAFAELVALLPDSRLADDAHLFLGMYYFDDADWDEAIAQYLAVYEKGPDGSTWYVEAMYQLAWSYYKQSKYDRALGLFVALLDHSEETLLESGRQSDYRPDAIKYMAISFVDISDRTANEEDVLEGDPVAAAEAYFSTIEPRDYEWDIYVELANVLTLYQRYPAAVSVYRKLQTDPRWLERPENPQFQMEVAKLLASGLFADQGAAAQAILEMTEMYSDQSQWWEANRNNPDALAVARDYIEDSLSDVAREYAIKANQKRLELGYTGDQVDQFPPELVAAYAEAAEKFQEYLDKFPISNDYYEMQWYLADILYKSQNWDRAEEQYLDLIKSKDYHPYGEGALYQLFVTRQKVAKRKFASFDKLPEDAVVQRTYTTAWGKDITVYLVPDEYARFIESADFILGHDFKGSAVEGMPDFQKAVDSNRRAVMYIPAQVYYHHGHYDQARPRLMELVETYRRTKEACFAAGLLVDSYQAEGDLAMVRQLSGDFKRDPVCPTDPNSDLAAKNADFGTVEEQAAFKLAFANITDAQELEDAGKHREAWPVRKKGAEDFLQFLEDYPASEYAAFALYNAANNYQIIGKVERSNELFEEYVNTYPDDDQSKPLYMRIAGNYEATFQLEKAIYYYLQLERLFPDYEDSADAIYNAAFLKVGLGQHQDAAKLYEYYASKYEKEDAQDIYFRAGEQWELVGDREAMQFYDRYLRKYGTSDPEKAMEAHYRVAEIYKRQGNERMFNRKLDDVLATFDKLAAQEQEIGPSGRRYAAEAAFRELEKQYQDFIDDELLPLHSRNEEKNTNLIMKEKPAELEELEEAAKAFIARYQAFEYSSAAFYLIGSAYMYYTDLGFGLTCPKDYNEEMCMIYEEILWEQVYPVFENVEEKGKNRLAALIEKARVEKQHNEWIDKAQLMLNDRDPFNWPAIKPELQGESQAVIYPDVLPLGVPEEAPEEEVPEGMEDRGDEEVTPW